LHIVRRRRRRRRGWEAATVLTPGCCSTWMEQQMTLTLLTLMSLGERRSEVRELLLERKMEKDFGILA